MIGSPTQFSLDRPTGGMLDDILIADQKGGGFYPSTDVIQEVPDAPQNQKQNVGIPRITSEPEPADAQPKSAASKARNWIESNPLMAGIAIIVGVVILSRI